MIWVLVLGHGCFEVLKSMDNVGYIIDLGLMEYQKAWDLQRAFWQRRVEGSLPDLLLLLEHRPVITLGRRGNRSHLLASEEVLKHLDISVFHVERGGDITYHGPGQLVAYPILDLKSYGYRLVRYIDQLEEVTLRVLKDFGIEGRRDAPNRGVWVMGEKIASIGVAIKRWVSFHGIALNYATELNHFDLIHPCGLVGQKITSMAGILKRPVSREAVVWSFRGHFKEMFDKNWEEKDADFMKSKMLHLNSQSLNVL